MALVVVLMAAAPPAMACSDDCSMVEGSGDCPARPAPAHPCATPDHECGSRLQLESDHRCCDSHAEQPAPAVPAELSLASPDTKAPASLATANLPASVETGTLIASASPPFARRPSGRSLLSLHQTLLI